MDSVVLRSRGTLLAVTGVAALVLAADQATKSALVAASPRGNGSGLVSFRLVRNTGASFGIGSGHPLLITLTAAAILAVAVALLLRSSSRAVSLSLAAVAGGAAGNLSDRLFRAPGLGRGAVVDWIHVSFYPPTFNLADVAIRLGALIALIAVIAPQLTTRRRTASLASPTRHSAELPGVFSTRTWALNTDSGSNNGTASAVSRDGCDDGPVIGGLASQPSPRSQRSAPRREAAVTRGALGRGATAGPGLRASGVSRLIRGSYHHEIWNRA